MLQNGITGTGTPFWAASFVTFGKDVVIHPYAVVGRVPDHSPALARQPERSFTLHIGDGVVIGPHAVVYAGSTIGAGTLIGDHASIREGCTIGERCVIGRAVTLHYDVTLGDEVRLQDRVLITGGMQIGSGSFIGPGVITSNDRRIDASNYSFDASLITPPIIGQCVTVGAGANILAGVTVGDGARIAAGALVCDNVPADGLVMGQKARLVA